MMRRTVLLGMLLLVGAPGALAQDALERTSELVAEARYVEARETLEEWWTRSGPTAEREALQRGLWLRALLTVDPVMAEMDYRRLVVEFPGGRHSDEALLRLAKGAEFMDDPEAAERYLEILVEDYPDSPLRVEARALREGLAHPPAEPPALESEVGATPDPEADPEVSPDPEVDPDSDVEPRPETPGAFTVQLGAFSTRERAGTLAELAAEEGLEVRIVQVEGSDLFRVRTGAFTSRTAADREVERIRALGLDALVSSDRERERPFP